MDEKLDSIKKFADWAHGKQLRKYSPDRYIVHPERVMNTVREYTNDIAVLAAALLHDVLEDTEVRKSDIEEFLTREIGKENAKRTLKIVEELTDVYIKKDYPQFSRKIRKQKEATRMEKISSEAQTVKYADILDNGPDIVKNDPDFAHKYLKEVEDLVKRMKKGIPELRQRTYETLKEARKELKNNNKVTKEK